MKREGGVEGGIRGEREIERGRERIIFINRIFKTRALGRHIVYSMNWCSRVRQVTLKRLYIYSY